MIWSVSTSSRLRTETGPVIVSMAFIGSAPVADVDEVALDGGRRGHLRADEVGAPAAALAPLEVAVRGRGAALAGLEDVGVHAQAHRAAGAAPVEAGGAEDLVEPLGLGLGGHRLGARDDHRVDVAGHLAALDQLGGGAKVADAAVRAGADEDAVEPDLLHRRAGLEPHVLERALVAVGARLRHRLGDGHDHRWRGAPGDERAQRAGVDGDLLVEAGVLVGSQLAPGLDRRAEVLGRAGAAFDPLERRVVGGDHAGAAAALDRHVADRHPALHRERLDRRAGELDDVAGGSVGAHLADRAEDQVLGGDAEAALALVADAHRLRLALGERLGGENVLDLAGADAERERPERAVGGGVGVAAHDRHAGLGDAELRPDHVDDALAVGPHRVHADAELLAVALERLDLDAAELVADAGGDRRAVGGHVVVGGGERAVGPADLAPGHPEAVEGLRAGDLVHEVEVDEQQALRHLVLGPDAIEQRLAHERRSPAETTASRTASSSPWFSKWCGRSASKVTASPVASSWRAPSQTKVSVPRWTTLVSRAPGSCIGGSPGPPVRAPGWSVWVETSARCPGS